MQGSWPDSLSLGFEPLYAWSAVAQTFGPSPQPRLDPNSAMNGSSVRKATKQENFFGLCPTLWVDGGQKSIFHTCWRVDWGTLLNICTFEVLLAPRCTWHHVYIPDRRQSGDTTTKSLKFYQALAVAEARSHQGYMQFGLTPGIVPAL